MNKTQNFGLTLPEKDDFYDIEVFNQNNRIIDTLLQELAGSGAKALIQTFTASGTFVPANHGLSIGDAVDVYIAGAGGGGLVGGGGGGHCILLRNFVLTAASFHIVIGAGGIGGQSNAMGSQSMGSAGGTSSAFGRSAPGGSAAPTGIQNAGGAGGSGGGSGGSMPFGGPTTNGGDGGTAGSGGAGLQGGTGAGNVSFTPINPYDGIAYGSGGGGAVGGRGGGTGGHHSVTANGGNGSLGGGGGGSSSLSHLGGNGGISGGGGGSLRLPGTGFLQVGGNGGNGIVYIYARPRRTTPLQAAITPLSELCIAKYRTFAVMKDDICIDLAVFHTEEEAQSFLTEGSWSGADAIIERSESCVIGGKWDGKTWVKEEPLEEVGS